MKVTEITVLADTGDASMGISPLHVYISMMNIPLADIKSVTENVIEAFNNDDVNNHVGDLYNIKANGYLYRVYGPNSITTKNLHPLTGASYHLFQEVT